MARKVNLDTRILVLYENGNTDYFATIEEAAEKLNLSVASIKIRANKSGISKSFPRFMWGSDKTAAYYRAKKSKRKGSNLEYDIVKALKAIGYDNVCRAAGESKNLDNAGVDIADPSKELELAIQAKCYQNFPNFFKLKKECKDKRDYVMIWKKAVTIDEAGFGTVAVMDVNLFYKLLKCFHKTQI